jgi:uncharacterized protein
MSTPHQVDPGVAPRWGLGDAVAGWVLAFAASNVVMGMALAATGHRTGDPVSMALQSLSFPPLWIGFVGVPIWAAATKGRGWVQDFRVRTRPVFDAVVGIPAGIAAQLIVVPLVSIPVLYLTGADADDLGGPARELADSAQGMAGWLIFALVAAVGAPIAEEVFFRGLLLRAMEKRWSVPVAVVGSSVVFGLTHLQGLQLAGLTAAGLVFALLAVHYDRLGPAIWAHVAFNATTVAYLWTQRS